MAHHPPTKSDLTGKPGDVELILGRMYNTIANAIDKVYNRDQEEKRTSQGATNIWTQSFGDNADADHPIEFVFRLPDDLLNVNKCVLDFTVSHFRTYSKGALGGGGGTSGSGTLHTTKAEEVAPAAAEHLLPPKLGAAELVGR